VVTGPASTQKHLNLGVHSRRAILGTGGPAVGRLPDRLPGCIPPTGGPEQGAAPTPFRAAPSPPPPTSKPHPAPEHTKPEPPSDPPPPQEVVAAVSASKGVVLMSPPDDSDDARSSLAAVASAIKPGTKVLVAESFGGRCGGGVLLPFGRGE
jgi:hypothetical protein